MKYKIFGKNIEINVDKRLIKEILKKELMGYKKSDENDSVDVEINFTDNFPSEKSFLNSPTIHKSFSNGFIAYYGSNRILYQKNKILKIYISISEKGGFFHKFLSMGYRLNYENVGQILHELVLVPISFFDKTSALIHASTMKKKGQNRVVMFGGTGGVGKTSLEILLCRELGYSFISDDIAVISNNTKVYPNLSYPKIYAYNTVCNDSVEKDLFKNRGWVDKFQWFFMKKYKGESKVRRAIAPNDFFYSVETMENNASEYYILYKTNTINSIEIEVVNAKIAARLTLNIIKNEYHSVYQHILWYENNCQLMKFEPIITMKEIDEKFIKIYQVFFNTVDCYCVKIPIDKSHDEFLMQMKKKYK
ncbi:hypothetical protein [sulfur-oxidizing endosymbiont of Gigantopelta aegis]|uniref:hypothetical protein n=1 Tax=sulfur-oxidizing endosymbiont of Gigantopelta aegis TaxID=2794934 RepID=UPI0018DB5A94|nr:hypothetical protein [sulfur-oxidizing endosymbiont of Gigantopelta aegis]